MGTKGTWLAWEDLHYVVLGMGLSHQSSTLGLLLVQYQCFLPMPELLLPWAQMQGTTAVSHAAAVLPKLAPRAEEA